MRNWLVGVWVGVIASIFVGAYVLVFGSRPTSTNPEDWAHFATYLSGTVGVTAVLGTLYAVVRTLGQQQALIDSQDELLKNQVEQLSALKDKNKEDAKVRKVDLAHKYAIEIFPIMLKDALTDMERSILFEADGVYQNAMDNLRSDNFYPENFKVGDFFKGGAVILLELAEERDDDTELLVKRIMGQPLYLINFSAMQISVDKDLFYYFESVMSDYWRVLECCAAYYQGLDENPSDIDAFGLLRLKRKPRSLELHAKNWYELGRLYRNKKC